MVPVYAEEVGMKTIFVLHLIVISFIAGLLLCQTGSPDLKDPNQTAAESQVEIGDSASIQSYLKEEL